MQLIDGKKIAEEILAEIKTGVARLSFQPVFCDILVGDDMASRKYVEMKAKKAESVGIKFYKAEFPADITTDELLSAIDKINKIENMCGIIIQLPLPLHIDQEKVLNAIHPSLDVDVLGKIASEDFYLYDTGLALPTALACLRMLDSVNLKLENKKIVVLGQGKLVGQPVTKLLIKRGLDPIIIRSTTLEKEKFLQEADIIISGIGKGNYLKSDMIKEGVILIDAGTSESGAGLIGDVDTDSVKNKAAYLSPCPGGVGPVTVAMLLKNVLKVAQTHHV